MSRPRPSARHDFFGWMAQLEPRLSREELRQLSIRLLDGPWDGTPDADEETRLLLDVVHAASQGRWAQVLDLTRIVSGHRWSAWLLHHRLAACQRQGLREPHTAARFQELLRSQPQPDLALERRIEEARIDMGVGRYLVALELLETIQRDAAGFARLSLMALFNFNLFLGTCLQALGRYEDSGACVRRQKAILADFPAETLKRQALRREVSLLVESERVREAVDFFDLHSGFLQEDMPPLAYALFKQEELRLALMRADFRRVQSLFDELERHVTTRGLPQSLLNMDEERCEVGLRLQGNTSRMIPLFRERLAGNQAARDVAAECVVQILLARVLRRHARLDEAELHARAALALCERWGFGKAQVRALLVLSYIAHQLGHGPEAVLLAGRAVARAEELDLPIQLACARLVHQRLTGDQVSLSILVRLFVLTRSLDELRHSLDCYGLAPGLGVRLESLNGPGMSADAFECVPTVASASALLWLPDEGLILHTGGWSEGGGLTEFTLSGGTLALWRMAWEQRRTGFTLEDIHCEKYPGVAYESLRHRDRAAVTLSRFRRALAEQLPDVRLERVGDAYVLRAELPLCAMRLTESLPQAAPLTARELDVLSHLGEGGPLLTADLCRRMGITRQTLHPMMVRLLATGRVVRRGGGKRTRYLLARGS